MLSKDRDESDTLSDEEITKICGAQYCPDQLIDDDTAPALDKVCHRKHKKKLKNYV